MATISETLSLYDGFTPVLKNIQQALNLTLNGFERMQEASERNIQVQEFELARQKLVAVGAEIGKVEQRQDELNRRTESYATKVENVGFNKWAMGITAVNQGMQLIERTFDKIMGFMEKSDESIMINNRIGMMNDGLLEHHELQKKILDMSNDTRASYANTVDLMSKLSMSGAFDTTSGMMDFSETINKTIRLGGGTKAMNDSAMLQLSQALGSGVLQGDELRSLSENAPFIMKVLADGLGVARGELKAMGADGELTTDKIIAAFENQSHVIDAAFNNLTRTWGDNVTLMQNKWTDFMQKLSVTGEVLNPLVDMFGEFVGWLATSSGQAFILGIATGIEWIVNGLVILGNIIGGVGSLFVENWDLISMVLLAAGVMLASVLIPQLITTIGLLYAQATAWMVANMPILMAVGAVMMFVIAIHSMGVTTEQVIGTITGLLFGLYAFIYNLVADLWNLIATFIEFFVNVWHDPIGSIARMFIGLADTVLGVLETIGNGIDAIFGSNLAGAVSGWRDNLQSWSDENFGEAKIKVDRMDKLDVSDNFNKGYDVGIDIANGATGIFDKLTTSMGSMGLGGNDINIDEVGKVKDPVEISSDDLKILRELAEIQAIQNFVTLQPEVKVTTGPVSKDVDIDEIVRRIEESIENEMAASTKEVYGLG